MDEREFEAAKIMANAASHTPNIVFVLEAYPRDLSKMMRQQPMYGIKMATMTQVTDAKVWPGLVVCAAG
jgi:hypothetical protein